MNQSQTTNEEIPPGHDCEAPDRSATSLRGAFGVSASVSVTLPSAREVVDLIVAESGAHAVQAVCRQS